MNPTTTLGGAQTVVDFTPLLNQVLAIVIPAVAAAVAALLAWLVAIIQKRMGIANNADQSKKIATAAEAAAGVIYNYAIQHEGGLARLDVKNAAYAEGIKYFTTSVGKEIDALGITPQRTEDIVSSRVGALLAKDPTVSAGAPTPIPAPATPIPVEAVGDKK